MIVISGNNVKCNKVVFDNIKQLTSLEVYSEDNNCSLVYSPEDDYNEKKLLTFKYKLISMSSNNLYNTTPKFINAIIYVLNKSYITHEKYFGKNIRDISKWLCTNDKPIFIIDYQEYFKNPSVIVEDIKVFLTEINKNIIFNNVLPNINVHINNSLINNFTNTMQLQSDEQHIFNLFYKHQFDNVIKFYDENNLIQKTENFMCKRTNTNTNFNSCQECLYIKQKREMLQRRAVNMNIDWKNQPCLYECKFKLNDKILTEQESIDNNSWYDKNKDEEEKLLKDVTARKFLYSMHFPEASSLLMTNKIKDALGIIKLFLNERKDRLK